MLRLLQKIEAKTEHRSPEPYMATAVVDFDATPPRPDDYGQRWWTWLIGVQLRHLTKGPEADREQLLRNARRAIAHEVYGEIEDEIHLALQDLWSEGMHRSKAADRLEKLLPLLRGED